jgi:hypothetical protein
MTVDGLLGRHAGTAMTGAAVLRGPAVLMLAGPDIGADERDDVDDGDDAVAGTAARALAGSYQPAVDVIHIFWHQLNGAMRNRHIAWLN